MMSSVRTPIDCSAKALTLAREIEKDFGFVTIGVFDAIAGFHTGATVTELWGITLAEPYAFTVTERGSLADWKRQQDWLRARYGPEPFHRSEPGRQLFFLRLRRMNP